MLLVVRSRSLSLQVVDVAVISSPALCGQTISVRHSATTARPCRAARAVMMRSQFDCSARVRRYLLAGGGLGELAVDRRADSHVKHDPGQQ